MKAVNWLSPGRYGWCWEIFFCTWFLSHAIVSFIKDLLKHVTKYEKLFTSSHRGLSVRKGVLKNFHKIHRKTPVPKSLF